MIVDGVTPPVESSRNVMHHASKLLRRALAGAVLAAACTLPSSPADAHFILSDPPSWNSQDSLGSPQKLGPCGDESGGTPTGTVTAFQQGQTITVTINETIFHPGHYRIALAVHDRSELPPEPTVTPDSTPCGTAPIMNPPVFPVLADGVFVHTSPLSGPQSVDITLPADVTCDKCTLQVIEFMSNHPLNNPGGCFYHHCADFSVTKVPVDGGGGPATTTTTSTGSSPTTSSATSGVGGSGGSGGSGGGQTNANSGCSVGGESTPAFAGLGSLFALAMLLRRRRS
jgi:uncharacterized protein (TIGR03382 family)